jgi:hypothetical protein
MYDLPVVRTVADAYRFTFASWRAVLVYALPLIILAVVAIVGISDIVLRPQQFSGVTFVAVIVIWFVAGALCVGFAVAMHRHYLIGPSQRGVLTTLSWGTRQWRFLGWAIVVGVGVGILSMIFAFPLLSLVVSASTHSSILGIDPFSAGGFFALSLTSVGIGIVIWFVVVLIMAGALLRFPLYAIDATSEAMSELSDLVRNNRMRIALIFLLGDAIPFAILDLIFVGILIAAGATDFSTDPAVQARVGTVQAITTLVQLLAGLFWLAVTAVMLSMIYNQLRDNVPTEPKTPA